MKSVRLYWILLIVLQASFLLLALSCAGERVDYSRGEAESVSLDSHSSTKIKRWVFVADLSARIALFDTVFWDPRDTESLRKMIKDTPVVKGRNILEIGTGSGLLSLYCLKFGALKVVATDVNRLAVANARYNAELLGVKDRFEARLVPLSDMQAYSVIGISEKFDLIISNPPWENQEPKTIAEHALYDRDFNLLQSLLIGLPNYLNSGGRALLAYGTVDAISSLKRIASEHGLGVQVLDGRDLTILPAVFLPGMLLEVSP